MIFQPTNGDPQNIKRARLMNMNWPILKDMYWGPNKTKCLASGEVVSLKSPWSGKWVINCDYDHVREDVSGSKDKTKYDPSCIIRAFDLSVNHAMVFELLACWPLTNTMHKAKRSYACTKPFTLKDCQKRIYVLRSKKNYDAFCKKYGFDFPEYNDVIKWLSDFDYPPIGELYEKYNTN